MLSGSNTWRSRGMVRHPIALLHDAPILMSTRLPAIPGKVGHRWPVLFWTPLSGDESGSDLLAAEFAEVCGPLRSIGVDKE